MLRCTRVWFPSKHDFFFQASFTKITAELRESVLHLFFFVTCEKIYSEDDNTIHTWNNWNLPSILFFFSNIDVMQCVGLENSYGISVKCRVLLKSIFPCYKFFCDISPCWRESQSFVSCKGCIKFSKIFIIW